jgi:hypothetical protein
MNTRAESRRQPNVPGNHQHQAALPANPRQIGRQPNPIRRRIMP